MHIEYINNNSDKKALLSSIECTTEGISIMQNKMDMHIFKIHHIKTPAANILKQDCLSLGADLAVPWHTITCKSEFVDAILFANSAQIKELSKKEKKQPFGLYKLSCDLLNFINKKKFKPKIMGILNTNNDSFYSKSRLAQSKKIVSSIEQMIEQGADMIDIGAVSSAPYAKEVSAQEEIERICPFLQEIYKSKIYEKTTLSIDSYRPKVIDLALSSGFKIVNDITGLSNEHIAQIASKYNACVVIMHMQGTPLDMQKKPHYENVILDIDAFFEKRLQIACKYNIKNIILDIGIGFGKSLEHNIALIKHLAHFSKFNKELLIGASRKSMIDKIFPSSAEDRLGGTIAIHLEAFRNGASIIRCHDVYEHKQALSLFEKMQ